MKSAKKIWKKQHLQRMLFIITVQEYRDVQRYIEYIKSIW